MTPTSAAGVLWDANHDELKRETPAASIREKTFKGKLYKVLEVVQGEPALREFRNEWTRLQRVNRVTPAAPRPAAQPAARPSSQAETVLRHMNDLFNKWRRIGDPDARWRTRGGWWNTTAPGVTEGAQAIPLKVTELPQLVNLAARTNDGGWRYTNSHSAELAFHREFKGYDFIYHVKRPTARDEQDLRRPRPQ